MGYILPLIVWVYIFVEIFVLDPEKEPERNGR